MKTRAASSSLIRATDASDSVRAAEVRRKCWAIDRVSASIMADTAWLVNRIVCGYAIFSSDYANYKGHEMSVKEVEREWAEKAQRFVKAELKRADLTYEELATRLRGMGLQETKISIASKLSRA